MTKFSTDFLPIPYIAIVDKKLTAGSRIVLGLIYYITQKRGEKCFMSNAYIGKTLGMTSGSVQNCLTKLEENGYIKRVFNDTAKRSRSEILCGVRLTKVSLNDVSLDNDTVSLNNDSEVSLNNDHNKINNNKINIINSEETSQKDNSINEYIELLKPLNETGYTKWFSNKTQRVNVELLARRFTPGQITNLIQFLQAHEHDSLCPQIATPLQMVDKLPKIEKYYKTKGYSKKARNETICA